MKISLVTGASSGLGRDIAKLLCEKGHRVYATARRRDQLLELKKECGKGDIRIIDGDLTDSKFRIDLINEILKESRKIDYLINNAGYGMLGLLEKIETKDIEGMINLNVIAMQHLSQLVLPSMKRVRKGRIINISSIAALEPPPYFATYNSTKYAVHGFTKSLSYELKGTGVSTSVVFPSRMKTPFWVIAFKCSGLKGEKQKACVIKWTKGSSSSLFVAKYIIDKLDTRRLVILPNLLSKIAYHFLHHFRFIGTFFMKTNGLKNAKEALRNG
ncbi:MAG: SDR family NAD(P)-dependent oxidoreductase [Nanoarchaeota archaeon]